MRVEDEEIYMRSVLPITARVGGVDYEGGKTVRVTITIIPQKSQTTGDIDLATASFIHAQELFGVLSDLVEAIREGDPVMQDVFEEAQLLLQDIKEYW